jgi:ABC-type lipoprotein export system ATPase subunit
LKTRDGEAMISLKNIHKSYTTEGSKMHVLRGINAEVEKGEMVSIMGSSGSGKSTLLKIIAGIEKSFQGDVVFSPGCWMLINKALPS